MYAFLLLFSIKEMERISYLFIIAYPTFFIKSSNFG